MDFPIRGHKYEVYNTELLTINSTLSVDQHSLELEIIIKPEEDAQPKILLNINPFSSKISIEYDGKKMEAIHVEDVMRSINILKGLREIKQIFR